MAHWMVAGAMVGQPEIVVYPKAICVAKRGCDAKTKPFGVDAKRFFVGWV
jgi:hypothetical protein